MNKISNKAVALLAVAAVAVLLGGCSIGSRIAKDAIDKAVKGAENALATVQASMESADPQAEVTPEALESIAPTTEEDSSTATAASEETVAPANESSGDWNNDIPAEVPKFNHGHYQKDQAAKYTTEEGTIISASFTDTNKENAKEYVDALKANKFDVSIMDIGDDLTAISGLKLEKQTLNVVCGYKNEDHSFSIIVTVVKN